jgi:malonyl-CoA O-methyltransferase
MPDPSRPVDPQSDQIDLHRVRALFSCSEAVRGSDFLRREIAGRMRERLELVKIAPTRVLDAGCGEGADLSMLRRLFPAAQLLGLDASPAMLAQARGACGASQPLVRRLLSGAWWRDRFSSRHRSALLCGDFSRLPCGADSIDLIWSNLALHWHSRPHRVFEEWRRVLRVDGLLMFSCFGPDTFRELRTAFGPALAPQSLPSFVDMHDFGDMLVDAGFSTPVMDMETITITYEQLARLMEDVRALGGNPLHQRRRGLLGRGAWRQISAAMEAMRRPDGRLPLTFEIIYGHAFRPAPRTTRAGEAIIRFEPGRR